MSMAEQKAMLEKYNKAKERGAKNELNFRPRPRPAKRPFCAYCKTEGHWMKNYEEVICPKLVEKNARANERRIEIERKWRTDVSQKVSKETGMSGWEPVGPIGSISLWPRKIMRGDRSKEVRKEHVKGWKNPFDMGEENDESEEEVAEEVPCVVEGEGSLSGAWAKPLKMGEVAEEKEVVEVVEVVEVEEVEENVEVPKYDPTLSWGDQF